MILFYKDFRKFLCRPKRKAYFKIWNKIPNSFINSTKFFILPEIKQVKLERRENADVFQSLLHSFTK